MNPDLIVARVMLTTPIIASLILLSSLAAVLVHGIGEMRSGKSNGPPGWMWQSAISITILQLMLCAAMDVGQSLVLFTEGWPGLAAIGAAYFGIWTGGQTIKAVKGTKGGEIAEIGAAAAPKAGMDAGMGGG